MNPEVRELIEKKRISEALKFAGKSDIEDLYKVGEDFLQSDPIKAEKILRRILEIEPENDSAHKKLGDCLHDLGRYNEAESEFKEAIMIKPDDVEYHCYLANLLVELGSERYKDAEKEFEEALRLKPDDYWTHNDFGVLLHNWKRYYEAEREFREGLRLKPKKSDEVSLHINLGTLFEEWGRYKEAKSEYEKAIAISRELILTKPEVAKDLARAHYNLGTLLAGKLKSFDEAKGEFKEAIRIFYEAIKNEPELAEELAMVHNNLGASVCDSEKYKEAKKEFEEAIRINKGVKKEDSLVYINLGDAYGKLNCVDLAIENFKNALESNPKCADAYQNLIRAEFIKKGVGLSWWDWWQTSRSKKWIGVFLGFILGGAIIYLGYLVYLDYQRIHPNLLILIAIALFLLLSPGIQYFKVKAGFLELEARYHPYQEVRYRKM
jgi:tetratricopeptide (TPR) repeat protein